MSQLKRSAGINEGGIARACVTYPGPTGKKTKHLVKFF